MLVISKKTFLHLALAAVVTLVGVHQPLFAQAASPQWKDRAEFDLYDAITKEQQPAKRLELLKQWKDKYEQSDYANARLQLVMTSYQQLGKGPETIAAANELLAKDPANLAALNAIMTVIYSIPNASADNLTSAEKAAGQVTSTIDALFANDKKPAAVSAADWTNAKNGVLLLAQNTLGYAAWQKKDYAKAETEFVKSLGLNPNQGQISYWLGTNILAQKDPKKQVAALWHFARAAAYDGPGALPNRADARKFLDRAYASYHGSAEGEDQLLAAAKASAMPPADLKILSKVELAQAAADAEAAAAAANPMLALWKSIKTALTDPAQGAAYFENSMKGAGLPGGAGGVTKFKGKLIEAKPEIKPKTLVLAIQDGTTADVTLNLDAPLAGKMEPGAEISFEGVASGYTASPFMVTFDVEKAKIEGWKGAPAPAPAKKAAPRPASKKK